MTNVDPEIDSYSLLIDGESKPARSGNRFTIIDPATEEPVAEVASAHQADIDDAVAAARTALEGWRATPPVERGRILEDIATTLRDNVDALATLVTKEAGKPLSQSVGEIEGCARYFEYYAGMADKIQGESIPITDEYVDYTVHEPMGVTAQIIPWNYPASMLGRSVAPALVSGNVSVLKPAEQTPITDIVIGELALKSGLPPGVLNVVPGFGETAGGPLAGHGDVDAVSFTGSVETGTTVAATAAENVVPVHLELGGKSPCAVFPDADLDDAVADIANGIFKHAGQICSASSRALVHRDVMDEFLTKLAATVEEIRIGPGEDDADLGPLVSETQFERVCEYIDIGRSEVGEPEIGGGIPDRTGFFVEPTVFAGIDNAARIAQEEIFGPVLCVIPFDDEREAIEIANDSEYGLVAGIFTSDLGRAHRYARDVEAGQVYINEWFAGSVQSPFGGYKKSGHGRQKGFEAIESYTQIKNVCANISK
jgi:aldehyde dehydrogenase (NAD+)